LLSILHSQWIELLEGRASVLPTPESRAKIGITGDDIWVEIEGDSPESWEPDSLGIPPVLGVFERGDDGSRGRIVTDMEVVGIFSQFVGEIIVNLKIGQTPSDSIRNAILELRHLLAGIRESLTKEKQRGLIGEMRLLGMAITNLGDNALETWTGPRKGYESLHDFTGSKIHIEAKSTKLNPPVVTINEIAQLDWRGNIPLVLAVSHITEHEEGLTLHEHMDEVLEMLSSNSKRVRLQNLARFVGYNSGQLYSTKHKVNSVRWFQIDANSQIIQPEILSDIPSSVLSFKYDLQANELQEIPEIEFRDLLE
jgi:hypothetical protein